MTPARRAVVVGLAVTGRSVCRALRDRGWDVVAVDDRPTEALTSAAGALGVPLVGAPADDELAALVASAGLVVVSPGVPAGHPVFRAGATEVVSELELASRWARAPMVAVTGTNGKTTVVTMVTEMLRAGGVHALAAGNIGLPLVDAVDGDAEVLVVEASSFQLALTSSFRPRVAVWLNLAEDHLDWHPDLAHYRRAKARIWANQAGDDVAVVNADDAAVAATATSGPLAAPARLVTFGGRDGDYRADGGRLVGPGGVELGRLADMPRAFPHDVANALAAAAAALAAGADPAGCRAVVEGFAGLPHRVALVGESGGVRYYDDSKATTPASVLAALAGFDSVVLIAGGRNKGLDLGALTAAADRVKAVVAIGESAPDVEAAFRGTVPVDVAASMDDAVEAAARRAAPGDVVLLSPGCASFDWYGNYAERGDDFARAMRQRVGVR